MRYNVKYIDGIAVIEIKEDIEFLELPDLKNIFREVYHSSVFNIVVDLKNAGTINSTAIGLIVSEWTRLKKVGGELVLCNANPYIKKILSVVGADRLVKLYSSREAAIKALKR